MSLFGKQPASGGSLFGGASAGGAPPSFGAGAQPLAAPQAPSSFGGGAPSQPAGGLFGGPSG